MAVAGNVPELMQLERKSMNRTSQALCGAAIILMAGAALSPVDARALFAYPMTGQTPEQENADRSACHDWAIVQSGYDPTILYNAQRGVIVTQSGTANLAGVMLIDVEKKQLSSAPLGQDPNYGSHRQRNRG